MAPASKLGYFLVGSSKRSEASPTTALESQELILETLAAFIESYLPQSFAGIGIGIPGLVDAQMGIVLGLANIPSFQHVELRDFLVNRFGKPVWINNDANCFALGVHQFGIGQGFQNLVGITLGTGVGAGIIIHGKLYSGVNSAAGEWCGTPYLDRTFEDYCSGKFFNRV